MIDWRFTEPALSIAITAFKFTMSLKHNFPFATILAREYGDCATAKKQFRDISVTKPQQNRAITLATLI